MSVRINLAQAQASWSESDIDTLVRDLGSREVAKREAARRTLERIGSKATPALMKALESPKEQVRWEAAQTLRCIQDPSAAPALVQTLKDDESAVRWLAARALVALGRQALEPSLLALEQGSDNAWMRGGVHHVLHALLEQGAVNAEEIEPVLEALENLEPRVEAPVAAYHALRRLRGEEG